MPLLWRGSLSSLRGRSAVQRSHQTTSLLLTDQAFTNYLFSSSAIAVSAPVSTSTVLVPKHLALHTRTRRTAALPWATVASSPSFKDLPNDDSHENGNPVNRADVTDTIYALSSAPGRAAIAVVRLSGPACLAIYRRLCPRRALPKPRVATLRRLRDPKDPERVLDTGALVLYFDAPNTVTGEDVLEFHVHGGVAVVRGVLDAIGGCGKNTNVSRNKKHGEGRQSTDDEEPVSIRPAEPGEFTKRAFYNARLDLTEAEALGETLAAETEQQHRLAVSGASSGLAQRYDSWRRMLLYARGELEALIDFSEDQHFDESPAHFMSSVSRQVIDLTRQIRLHVDNASRGELLRSGISVALLGAPNAGKSSLLNRVVGREAVIVSSEAGTTRDIIDVNVDIGGWLVKLGDMAGLRASLRSAQNLSPAQNIGMQTRAMGKATDTKSDPSSDLVGAIEREGIRRARERALQSDLVIALISIAPTSNGTVELVINSELTTAVSECQRAGKSLLFVLNKIDLLHEQQPRSRTHQSSLSQLLSQLMQIFPNVSANDVFCLSCKDADAAAAMDTMNSISGPERGDYRLDTPDPGGLQTFLTGLTDKFKAMTTAAAGGYPVLSSNPTSPFSSSSPTQMTQAEAQSYWAASLSVTQRQSECLRQCLVHLNDFLDLCPLPPSQHLSTETERTTTTDAARGALHHHHHHQQQRQQQRQQEEQEGTGIPPLQFDTRPSDQRTHHVDGHDDLVGEVEIEVEVGAKKDGSNRPQRHNKPTNGNEVTDTSNSQPFVKSTTGLPSTDTRTNDVDLSVDGAITTDTEIDIVTAAEHLRYAAQCLAKITGRTRLRSGTTSSSSSTSTSPFSSSSGSPFAREGEVEIGGTGDSDIEEVLGVVFEKFCVGK